MFKFVLCVALFSTVAFADYYEGNKTNVTFERTASTFRTDATRNLTITAPVYYVSTRYVWEEVYIPVLVCEEITWTGDWKTFYVSGKSFDERSKNLAEAIKGVGEATAPALVPYLLNKPATWKEFAEIIKFADEQIGHGLAYKVLSEYGRENMINLGYYSEELCNIEYESESRLVPKISRSYSHDETQKFEIRITEAPLVFGEKEKFTIRYNGADSKIYLPTKYNNYSQRISVEDNTIVYKLVGNRKQVTPPNRVDLSFTTNRSEMLVKLFDTGFIGSRNNGTTIVATLHRSIPMWFDEKVEVFTFEMTDQRLEFVLPTKNLKKGKKYYFTYQIKRHDTLLYNDELSNKEKSDKVKI